MAPGGHRSPESGLAGQPEADPPPVAGRGPEGALPQAEEAAAGHRPGGRGDVPDPAERGVGDGLPVRPDRRWPPAEAAERDRRVQPGVPGHRRGPLHQRR